VFVTQLPRFATAGSASLYVANESNGTIQQFSESGAYLGVFQSGLSAPAFISTNPSGDLFVSNAGSDTVQEYSPQGSVLMTISTPFAPGQALVTASGTILVANYYGGDVYAYSSTGQSMGLFANPGLLRADFMALDSQGNLYVTDFMSGNVSKISPTGVLEGNIIQFAYGVTGIAFGNQGDIYLGLNSFNGPAVLEYSGSGTFLGAIASTGLVAPYGLTFGPDGNLYIADYGNNTIDDCSPTGANFGVFASTGLDGPRSLVFGGSVPEPSSAGLLTLAGLCLIATYSCRRVRSKA